MDTGGAQEALTLNAEIFDTDKFRERGELLPLFMYPLVVISSSSNV